MTDKKKLIDIVEYKILEKYIKYDWDYHARDNQKIPNNPWKIWLILAGRGFGKTRTGAETIKYFVKHGYRNICLLGGTINEVRRIMIEGESGLLNIYEKYDKPVYFSSRNMIIWPNGAIAHIMSAENYEALRGPQFDLAWIDEFAKFKYIEQCWNQLMMTMRLGDPKIIITTTPRPITLIKKLMQTDNVVVTRGTTYDNKQNLAQNFIDTITNEYGNTSFGSQEIYGNVLSTNYQELWNQEMIQYADTTPQNLDIIIAIDPAVTSNSQSNETGILIIGKNDIYYYIIEDMSTNSGANIWMYQVIKAYYKYSAAKIIIEINQGGNLFKESLINIDENLYIEEVRASKNKYIRAQPVTLLYEKKLVYHSKVFSKLEEQMLHFSELLDQGKSPDRVDAMVWGILELKKSKTIKIL